MATEDLKISSTGGGKTNTTTISNVNPEVTNADLAQFGTMLIALTSNLYNKSDRVITVNVDTEPGGGTKPTPTLSMSVTSVSAAALDSTTYYDAGFEITTNSDGEIATSLSGFNSATGMTIPTVAVFNKKLYIHKAVFTNQTATGTIHVTVLPSANYGISNTIDFTVTA